MENERFEVKDDLTAKWAADKIREKKAELAQLKRWYDAQYASAEARTTSEIGYLEVFPAGPPTQNQNRHREVQIPRRGTCADPGKGYIQA